MSTVSSSPDTLKVRVRAVTWEAASILGFELVPMPPAAALPAFTAGAHVDLHLPGGLVRSYSLLNDPRETHRYCIGVNLDAKSRGGSRYMHEGLHAGSVLTISAPRNHFPLDESSPFNVFIAGGIGITPMLSMIARSNALGTPWRLHYAARTREYAAFLGLTESMKASDGDVRLNFDQEPGGQMLDLAAVVAAMPEGSHVYCCGPLPMLHSFEAATAGLPPHRAHREYFAAPEASAPAGGFTVELARSGRQIEIQAGQSILDALIAQGVDVPYSCGQGVCGTCEVRVLEGTADHRDFVMSPAEQEANDRLMICCSGAKSARLVLDL